nr:type I-B CRISPR-associated protein Cas8b/Csh1 [Clostridium aciditolerans]
MQKDSMILGEYIPADGAYAIVDPVENGFELKEIVNIKLDKKTKKVDRTIEFFDFICRADYNSKLIDMNKPIDGKKIIQSNNYLSFIIKKESLTNGKLTNEIIDNYYKVLEDPLLKYSKPKAIELYKAVEEEIGKPDNEKIIKIKEWIKDNTFNLLEDNSGKDYLKVFFHYSDKEFEREGKRYLVPNIYNSNDFNIKVGEEIYGLPNDNMGLNAKKPYLEHKTRKVNVPYLINQDEVIYQKKFFDYLMNQVAAGKTNIYIGDNIVALKNGETPEKDFRGMYFRIKKGKEVEIHDFDIIPRYSPKLGDPFQYKNVLNADNKILKQEYDIFSTIGKMQSIINEVFFSNFLIGNYFTEAKDLSITDDSLKSNLLISRTALFNWIHKGNENNIGYILDKVSLSLIKGSIRNGYGIKAIKQFNLRASLNKYFQGGEDMADVILDVKENLRNKISVGGDQEIENDKEYFFAVGQLVSFFLSQSKSKKKPLSLANPFINAKKDEMIKEKLKALFKKYNYDLKGNIFRFRNLYSMVAGYEVNNKINDDMIIAGYLHSNLLFEKSNKENQDNNGEGEE